MLSYLFVILLYLECVKSFNIDTKSPFVYLNPLINQNSSLFGYSVQLYPEKGSINAPGIFIGAPEGSYRKTPGLNSGVLVQCPIQQQCKEIFIQTSSTKTNSWLGGSIDIDNDFENLVTCAHRSTTNHKIYGDCYWFNITNTNARKLKRPTDIPDTQGIGKTGYYNYYIAQIGTSAHFADKNVLILGAPGLKNWEGNTIRFNSNNKNEFTSNGFLAKNKWQSSYDTYFGLTGYSVASGRFYSDKKLYYVSGGPKAFRYTGYIVIYEFIGKLTPKKKMMEFKNGEQFGEYFGSCLTVGDVNNDGFDDLIVGAPFYTNSTFNEGRVHVFLGGGKERLKPARIGETISGTAVNGQFGTTLQFLGDLNKDGFGDVAIAAPYELENSGVVYIFEGSEFGLNPEFTQRIVGREVFSEIRGFGISISKPVDIDKNKYLDLAIGAHFSGHVVVFQTSPVIHVFHFLDFNANETHIKEDAKDFQIKLCFYATSTESEPINITRHLVIDEELERVQMEDNKLSELITINPKLPTCQILTVTLKESVEKSNPYIPIKISLRHTFEQTPQNNKIVFIDPKNTNIEMSHFCVRCPVYDKKRSSQLILKEFPFSLGCRDNNICTSHLEITQEMSNIDNGKIILGLSDSVILNVKVNNSGEYAYQAYLSITKPEVITIKQLSDICEEKSSTVIQCTFNKPITADQEEKVFLEFDLSSINKPYFRAEKPFSFETTIFTSSENSNPIHTKTLQVGIVTEADMKLTGKSGQDTYSYGKITKGKPDFSQSFQIEKIGPSSIDLVEIDITIPHSIQSKNDKNNSFQFIEIRQPVGKLDEKQFSCDSNFLFLTNYIPNENTDDNNNNTEIKEEIPLVKRNKRQTINPAILNQKNDTFNENNTIIISCNDENIICTTIKCSLGPFQSQQNIGIVKIRMVADIKLIKENFGKDYNDIIIRSNASVRILNPRNVEQSGDEPDFVQVSTFFIGDKKQPKILLILIISIVSGILLLLLLIFGLVKAGFFKRSTKEKLLELKKQMEDEEHFSEANQSEEIFQSPDERDEEQLEPEEMQIE